MSLQKGGSVWLQGAGVLFVFGGVWLLTQVTNETAAMAAAGVMVAGVVLAFLGRKKTKPAERPLPVGGPELPVPRVIGDAGGIDAVLAMSTGVLKRQCWGELYLGNERLWYICYADRMAIGSVGPVIQRRQAVLAQLKGVPLEQAVTQSQFSRSFGLNEVAGFKKSFWTGQSLTAAGVRHQFVVGLGRADRDKVRVWCAKHGIACEGF